MSTLKEDLISQLATFCDVSDSPGISGLLRLLKRKEVSGKLIVDILRGIIWGGGDTWDSEEYSRLFWDSISDAIPYESLSPDEKETLGEMNGVYAKEAINIFEAIDDYFSFPENCRIVNHSINRWVCRAITYLDFLNVIGNLSKIVFENYEHFYPRKVNNELTAFLKRRLPYFQAELVIKQMDVDIAFFLENKNEAVLSQFEKELLGAAKENIKKLQTKIYDIVARGGE